MKLKLAIPKPVAKMLERLVGTGLYGRSLEECAFRLIGDSLQKHLARGGLLHEEKEQ